MKNIIEKFEGVLDAINKSEIRNKPEASAKAFEIKEMIEELKTRHLLIPGTFR